MNEEQRKEVRQLTLQVAGVYWLEPKMGWQAALEEDIFNITQINSIDDETKNNLIKEHYQIWKEISENEFSNIKKILKMHGLPSSFIDRVGYEDYYYRDVYKIIGECKKVDDSVKEMIQQKYQYWAKMASGKREELDKDKEDAIWVRELYSPDY